MPYTVTEHSIFTPRPLRVVCIGSGFSGIYLAIRIKEKTQNVTLQIYEKNAEVGGTWFENKYPGAACDVPAAIYSFSFDPNTEYSHYYAGHSEIQKYLLRMADKYETRKVTAFGHKVLQAVWSDKESHWDLVIEKDGQTIQDTCDVLINAGGILNKWQWPKIDGLKNFKGPLLHSARWDDTVDLKDKRVAIIGSGSSSIQIVPKIQPLVKRLDAYIRSPTWISLPWAMSGFDATEGQTPDLNPAFSAEQQKKFREDKKFFLNYRKGIESEFNHFFDALHQNSPVQAMLREVFAENMRKSLSKKPELAEVLIPKWDVGCRRLTPGVGYLEALCEDNVDVIRDDITRITERGIVTSDGTEHVVDVLICATGFDTSFKPQFKLVGRNGFEITEEWAQEPRGYFSLTIEEMPNYWVVNGPNACVGNGSLIPVQEREIDYFVRAILKMQREAVKSMCIKTKAVEEFTLHVDTYMPRTSWSTGCRSWYKNGKIDGRVSALWPGSSPHFLQAISDPRWEDYEWTYEDPECRYSYLGDGYTALERTQGDNSWYLDTATVTGALWGSQA